MTTCNDPGKKTEKDTAENELCFENIYKSYGKTKALQGFTATLKTGIHALLGPNGSGKSTLMNIITGNLREDAGSILFRGRDIRKMGSEFRKMVGFMPQYPGMYPSFSAEKFLWYMSALKGMPKEQAAEQIPEVLREVELSDVAGRKISGFSGGMKQRLALAQAVLGDPAVLILDEPTAGLDPKQRIAVRNYISRIAFNKVVIIASHVVSDVEYIARDVIFLKKGVIAENASPAELVAKMNGKVFIVPAREEEVAELQQKLRVVNISKSEDGVRLRVLSEEKPTESALPAPPCLEDHYLWVFGSEAGGFA